MRNVVITAAHCIDTEFDFDELGQVDFEPNDNFPTIESTYRIFAGVFDNSFAKVFNPVVPYPSSRLSVSKIIQVYS
jgi:hypothetical protein